MSALSNMAKVLVVGSGMTGCAAAALLRQRLPTDTDITIWDKARGTGGRMSTSRSSTGPSAGKCLADLGAQYITLTAEYRQKRQQLYSELQSKGVLAPLKGQIEGPNRFDQDGAQHFVTPQGVSSLVKYFLQQAKATVEYNHQVSSVEEEEGGVGGVRVTDTNGVSASFQAVVLTMPVPQILQLAGTVQKRLADQPEVREKLCGVSYSSRYALGLFYPPGTELPYTWCAKYFDNDPCIRFVAVDNKKRGIDASSTGPSVVVHTVVPFGLKHIDEDKEKVKDIVMAEVTRHLPDLPPPAEVKSQKWRYSQVHRAYPGKPGCVTVQEQPLIVLGGDGFSLSTFDGCLDSAEAIADTVVDRFTAGKL
ncbi:renalase-like [Babylonia areolata]|uniref:renalase-like n=1 Tax=Babylonia areolata TaxID=304850 RepID=UPI003FD4AE61